MVVSRKSDCAEQESKNGTPVKVTHMPTYVCSAPAGLLDDGRKAAMAEAITRIHSEETGAPTFFVQVVFEERQLADGFLGGTRASGQMWIRADIRAGRTDAQRQTLMLRIMREVSRVTGVREDAVWIYLCNLAPTDMIEYGHVLPKPGDEAAWFESLPASVKEYLTSLGTTEATFKL